MKTLREVVARGICAATQPQVHPDDLVEWGPAMEGPKSTRVVLGRHQCPAWHQFTQEAFGAITAVRAWIEAQPAKTDDEIREQVGALAIIDAALVSRETGGE